MALLPVANLLANPQGMTVANGTATATANGATLDVTASHNAFLNWQSFNIAPGETTTFHQPSAGSVVWNKINDSSPSQIWGHLNANGVVVLMNQSGFFFGPGSMVNAAGLVATTVMPPPDFASGNLWQFNGPPPAASIVNYGEIKISSGGNAFLIAENVQNHGTISAPGGTVGLYAGKEVLLSERPDGRGLSVQVSLPGGSVDNQGKLVADAGTILLQARTVNQNGLLQANSVQEKNGVIELVAGEDLSLGPESSIQAVGDDQGVSPGGQVTVKAGNLFTDAVGSRISVAGGALGGNGGQVELSAPLMPAINSAVDGHAASGSLGGDLLIDPTSINLGYSGTGSANGGNVGVGDTPGTLNLSVNSAFTGLGQITLQASQKITLLSGVTWDLAQSTGISAPGSLLSLEAGTDIVVQNNASLKAGPGWSVFMSAGTDFSAPNLVKPGTGSILLQGNGSLEGRDGALTLLAGKDVTVGSGFIRTVGGGGISVTARSGSVNTGNAPASQQHGFVFNPEPSTANKDYLTVDPNLTGISTAAGGDVSIAAGQNITSFLPAGEQAYLTDAGSGAFGASHGNVTLTAGGNVVGHYVVRNGAGTMNAGANAGTLQTPLALSLIAGGWQVHAAKDILLQEVRNPNGIFNNLNYLGRSGTPTEHFFDYAPTASVELTGDNSVQLLGTGLPRASGTFEQNIPAIYPPSLEITAGPGGVKMGSDVELFPSPVGQLELTTTSGGAFSSTKATGLATLAMSDSATRQYNVATDFGPADHAEVPLHLNDPNPVRLDISGDLNQILLVTPKETQITIGGNMLNSRFNVQNLHRSDISSLTVAGDILNRNEFTTVADATAPDFSVFDRAFQLDGSLASLPAKFYYDASAHTLTFRGAMSQAELNALLSLQVQSVDPTTGQALLDAAGNPIVTTVAVLEPSVATALFNASHDVPQTPNTGYFVAGPGALNISARNLDLGATRGIQSIGPRDNPALAPLGASGAAINLNLTGNLDMFSTAISTLAGGDININAGGNVNVGSSIFTGDQLARGIFTVAKSDVSVMAGGDININGSRIAAYDGGNITVISTTGNVDAGHGAQGAAEVEKVLVDPATGEVKTYSPTIPGSGILATTFPNSLDPAFPNSANPVGNIRVETPQGNITASAGGIVQLSLNQVPAPAATVTLRAGTKDAQGNVLYRGSIDASGSGVIGGNVNLEATAGIKGLVVAQQNINIVAQQSVSVTAIGSGNVNVSAGGTVSGTIVGVGSVNASGTAVEASLLSQNVSASGNTAGAQVGFAQANVAGATSQSAVKGDQDAKKAIVSDSNQEEEDLKKKQRAANSPVLTKRVGRVTVILPSQN